MKNEKFKEIEARIDDLRKDYESGASSIALKGAEIMAQACASFGGDIERLQALKQRIIEAKPAMAALKNLAAAAFTVAEKSDFQANADDIYKKTEAKFKIARKNARLAAKKKIKRLKLKKALTCSYSSAVVELIKDLAGEVCDFRLVAIESKWKGKRYGAKVCEALRASGGKCNIAPDDKTTETAAECDFAIIGADAFNSAGDAINGVPSKALAESVNKLGKPFFVVAESYKKSGELIVEEGFETIDAELIDEILTDDVF